MSNTASKISLAGWGRYHPEYCTVFRPERDEALMELLESAEHHPRIARGLGRSYGDAAVNGSGAVVDMSRLNRMLAFDADTGLLECEGGVSLAEIIEAFVPRGYFLPVTPGTKFVTVAGAIANDVHGKNHHCDGTFTQFVDSFRLWTPARGIIYCSPEENSDVFWATAGGIGLTGIILSARLKLRPIESAYVRVDYQRCADLDTVLSSMSESDQDYLYSVAWIDCVAGGDSLGRSVLMRGNHADAATLPAPLAQHPLHLPKQRALAVPVDFPSFVLNTYSVKAFNALFFAKNKSVHGTLVNYDKYFYPLDGIHQWNKLYGKRGFIQYQATFPFEGRQGLQQMLERLSRAGRASFLAVLKCFGPSNPGLLSHPMPGYTLALDLPNRPGLEAFTRELDKILLDHGGRLYLAKDTLTWPDAFAAMYPGLADFVRIKRALDPEGMFSSAMSRRLHLDG